MISRSLRQTASRSQLGLPVIVCGDSWVCQENPPTYGGGYGADYGYNAAYGGPAPLSTPEPIYASNDIPPGGVPVNQNNSATALTTPIKVDTLAAGTTRADAVTKQNAASENSEDDSFGYEILAIAAVAIAIGVIFFGGKGKSS